MEHHAKVFSQNANGIYVYEQASLHRGEEYDEHGFELLMQMQRDHFWYSGRHKFILSVLDKTLPRRLSDRQLRGIDMGGGCGGWIEYLYLNRPTMFQQLALADSSLKALTFARPIVGDFAQRYQIDLLELPWREEWDIVFLLDVLEHIPDHGHVIQEIQKTLKPGGLLVITTPALNFFWTYNDDIVHHQRRYSKNDFRTLSMQSQMKLLRADYFMFLLSPALLLNRLLIRPPQSATPEQIRAHVTKTHQIPPKLINATLAKIFSLEASLVNAIRFPWGTSVLAILQKE